jgi:hypothetical protein
MRLTTILFLLGLKLRFSASFDGDFRKTIRGLDRIVVIRTLDGRRAHSYVFRDDTVRTRSGIHPGATVELVWDDSVVAAKTMLSGDPLATFSAMGRGDLAILGNLQDALWFSDLVG